MSTHKLMQLKQYDICGYGGILCTWKTLVILIGSEYYNSYYINDYSYYSIGHRFL